MNRIELYDSQKMFISDVKKIIDSEEIGIFSSPTGTGKTISLLMSVVEYIDCEEESGLNEMNQELERILFHRSRRTRVFYCSRTHTQLSQVINELKRLGIRCNSVVLGSRRNYCINDKVSGCNEDDDMNERCREVVKDGCCSFYDGYETFDGHGVMDIEDLLDRGRKERFCPYYGSKAYSGECEIVFLPYQLLFTRDGRKSMNIDVRGCIVIVDEAHNIYDSIIQMNTMSISHGSISKNIKALELYKKRYLTRLKNNLFESVIEILKKIEVFWTGVDRIEEDVMNVSEFLIRTNIYDFNMIDIEDYLVSSGIVRKIEGFGKNLNSDLIRISRFLALLTMSDEGGRIFYNRNTIRFTALDPSMYVEDVMECKSLILAGGTMEPVDQLMSMFKKRSCHYFSYGSVCNDFMLIVMRSGASGREIVVNYESRENEDGVRDVVSSISNLMNVVKRGGMVCFLPSRSYLKILKERCGDTMNGKRILYEDSTTLQEYDDEVKRSPCVLFAIMGARLSEGINFSDELCRLLVVVGVPYPSPSVELKERMKFNGNEYLTSIAMRIVNQTLGRALRHKDDHAALVLLDRRYVQLSKFISPWMKKKMVISDFRDGFYRTNQFLNLIR